MGLSPLQKGQSIGQRVQFPVRTPTGSGTSSAITVKRVRLAAPNEVVMATSEASRPVAISTRPIRGMLLRASNIHHWFVQINLEPRAEIHGRYQRNADVAKVSGGVACRNIQGAAERDRQVLIIAAHSHPICENVERGAKADARAGSRTSPWHSPSRTRPAPVPNLAEPGRTVPSRCLTAGPPRSSGCSTGR